VAAKPCARANPALAEPFVEQPLVERAEVIAGVDVQQQGGRVGEDRGGVRSRALVPLP